MKTDYAKYFFLMWVLIAVTMVVVTAGAVAAPTNGYTMEVGGTVEGSMFVQEQNAIQSWGNVTSARTSNLNLMSTRGSTEFAKTTEVSPSGLGTSMALTLTNTNLVGDEGAYSFMCLTGDVPYCENAITGLEFNIQNGMVMSEIGNTQDISTLVNSNIRHSIAIDGTGSAAYQSGVATMSGVYNNSTPKLQSMIDQSFGSRFNGDINVALNFEFNSRTGIPQGLPTDIILCPFS